MQKYFAYSTKYAILITLDITPGGLSMDENVINTDLSVVMNSIFEGDSQRSKKGGGIQLLTHNVISRIDLTEEAFVMALTKFINGEDWK